MTFSHESQYILKDAKCFQIWFCALVYVYVNQSNQMYLEWTIADNLNSDPYLRLLRPPASVSGTGRLGSNKKHKIINYESSYVLFLL